LFLSKTKREIQRKALVRWLRILAIFVASLLLMIVISPLRSKQGGGLPVSSLVGFLAYFGLSSWLLFKYSRSLSPWKIFAALFFGLWALNLPIRIIDFQGTLVSLPEALLHTLGIVCGFLIFGLKKPYNLLTAFSGIAITIFMFYAGWHYWIHKLNHGTFTGRVVSYDLPTRFEATDQTGRVLNDTAFKRKVVVLDFWTTTCGLCFERFPQLESLFKKYQNDVSVLVLAVNSPIDEDRPNQAFQMITERNYTFPVVVATRPDMAAEFGVFQFPVAFVVNQNGQIVYRGELDSIGSMVQELDQDSP